MSDLAGYRDLIAAKAIAFEPRGLTRVPALNGALKDHQAHCVQFSVRAGSSAEFLDTGLGKSFIALEWGRIIVEATNLPVLMLAPLAVSKQHEREAARWGIDANGDGVADPNNPTDAIFSAAGFSSEELAVYRATDGKRLLGVRVSSPSSSRDGYALSRDGSQLAVLTREQVSVYSVPSK